MEREHFYSADTYYKKTFGAKVYRLPVDGGFTCPNRDGRLGEKGCFFCSASGSGDFTPRAMSGTIDIGLQLECAKQLVNFKKPGKYIAYLQSFTNTYASTSYLEKIYSECLREKSMSGLCIGTRPDCINDNIASLISQLSAKYGKPVYIELGLQTIHDKTEKYMGRGYCLKDFDNALDIINKYSLPVIVHLIIGLPEETTDDYIESVRYVSSKNIHGIKISLLNIISGTVMEKLYNSNPSIFPLLNPESYIAALAECIKNTRKDIVIYRLTGDAPKKLLVAPLFAGNKKLVLNSITKYFKENNIYQGSDFPDTGGNDAAGASDVL